MKSAWRRNELNGTMAGIFETWGNHNLYLHVLYIHINRFASNLAYMIFDFESGRLHESKVFLGDGPMNISPAGTHCPSAWRDVIIVCPALELSQPQKSREISRTTLHGPPWLAGLFLTFCSFFFKRNLHYGNHRSLSKTALQLSVSLYLLVFRGTWKTLEH